MACCQEPERPRRVRIPKATLESPRPPLVKRVVGNEWVRRGAVLACLLLAIISILWSIAAYSS